MVLAVNIDSFSYGLDPVLENIHFDLNPGEHLSILGESGCGKSTLLHLIYGLLDLDHGTLFWGDKPLLGPSHNLIPGEEFMKLVAQDPNVMPYTKVAENVATHLSRENLKQDRKRVDELLKVVSLKAFSETKVKNLSGGQKQRVALAKALAKTPSLLLLDEPFSHIDSFKKNTLRGQLYEFLKKEKISCITATHDAEEALSFSDRILILKKGKQERIDSPENIFNQPENRYQAGFFGEVTLLRQYKRRDTQKNIWLPHEISISKTQEGIPAQVVKSLYKGTHYVIQATFENQDIFFNHPSPMEKETKIFLTFKGL